MTLWLAKRLESFNFMDQVYQKNNCRLQVYRLSLVGGFHPVEKYAQVKFCHPPKVGVNKQKDLKPPPRSLNLEGFGIFSRNFAALKRVLRECSSADLP